jgi:hypothetical protein
VTLAPLLLLLLLLVTKLSNLASEDAGRVFVTDSILTTIMCAAKSVYSWDVVVTRVGDKLFFDKREGSSLDLLTVNETAPEQVRGCGMMDGQCVSADSWQGGVQATQLKLRMSGCTVWKVGLVTLYGRLGCV